MGHDAASRAQAAAFNKHLREACLGQGSEIFDGDAPHKARGCAAQAWSVAAVLHAAMENVQERERSAVVARQTTTADH